MPKQIIVIGKGHSGTRAIMGTLAQSGVFVGRTNGPYYDHIPPFQMYAAVSLFGLKVYQLDDMTWDFSRCHTSGALWELYRIFVAGYVQEFQGRDCYAWKLPESILALPWLIRLFPKAYYIHWVRDGRDNILVEHQTDYLSAWNVPTSPMPTRLECAAISWHYVHELVEYINKPAQWLTVRFEDFVLRQAQTMLEIQAFLGLNLRPVAAIADRVGRWRRTGEHGYTVTDFQKIQPILQKHLQKYEYV